VKIIRIIVRFSLEPKWKKTTQRRPYMKKTNRKQVKRRVFERSGGMMAEDEGIGGELVV